MKLTKEIKEKAKKLFNAGHKKLFVNKKGEFFTSVNLAALSVNDPEKELLEITPADVGLKTATEKADDGKAQSGETGKSD